ncbi:DUF6318 family protein [Rothia sp. HMSC069C04]|jgi:isocitrate/isopropylmalate dehydrogenase|uniref:DUF6318 family protein n=1 Tax=Rothia sp. HMSC069C04 TaxID=1739383 RepID=UPI0008A4E1AF|nr:DUF6318 family protein [Rothia sp. HMSC069C04]OFR63297.1 3-isopropylmalate dehydrogenase [Rothia sp. HMSC069C04]
MSTFVTRRAALGIATTAALASLTACASDIRPLSDQSTPDAQRSYKGELKFNGYESRGTYVPATRSKKAENPPKPIPPAKMRAKTTEGMYAAIGFWVASFNYLLLSGDIEPFRAVDTNRNDLYKVEAFVELYKNNTGWMYGTDAPISAELTEDAPEKVSEHQYRWRVSSRYHKEATIHYTDGRELTMASLSSGPGDYEFFFILEYQDGAWTVRNEPAKLTTSSPSSSASSSGTSI